MLCIFGWLAASGRETLAIAVLLLPLQLLAWLLMGRSSFLLLLYFSTLLPLTSLEMMPSFYVFPFFYLGTAILLILSRQRETERSVSAPVSPERFWFILLGVTVFTAGVSAAIRGWGGPGLVRGSIRALTMLVYAWLFASLPTDHHQIERLALAVVLGTAGTCMLLPLLPGAVGEATVLGGKVIQSPFAVINLNALAAFLAGVAALALGLAVGAGGLARKALIGTAILVLVAALLYTKSRGAWAGLGVALLYISWRSRSRGLLLVAILTLLATLSLETFRVLLLKRVTETSTQDPSLLGRYLLWKYALLVSRDNWLFGVGMENFRHVKQLYGFPWPGKYGLFFNAHSLYLEFLVGLGIPGVASLLVLAGRTLRGLNRCAREFSAERRGLALGLYAALLAQLVHGLFDALTWQHGAFTFLGVTLGLGLAFVRVSRSSLAPEVLADRRAC